MATATTIRNRDASRKLSARKAERDVPIATVRKVQRRRACLRDTVKFLRTYFGDVFSQPFTPTRNEMVAGIEHAARYGGDQAIAGPRGEGKTRLALFVTLKLMLAGQVAFPIIISKSGSRAKRELKNLKDAVAGSRLFAEDFPEIAKPIIALGGWNSRARQQTVYGEPTRMEWGEECIIFPTIETDHLRANGWNKTTNSAAAGQVMASVGIEGAIRGYSIRNRRPDLAIIDDIDDRESARSEIQTTTRRLTIEEDIGGLAGPDQTIARLMLCTLLNQTCIAAEYTDRAKKPSWRGQRHKLLATPPDRSDLWDEYVSLREARTERDPDARNSHRFYLKHRKEMDAGAVVTNPYRFDNRPLADGEAGQVSALQACFDIVADRGWEHFSTEYQNEPPAEDGPIESGITAARVQRQLSGYPRKIIPPDCVALTRGIDVQKAGLYWVNKAWRQDATTFVVDYGFHESHGTVYGSDEGLETSIVNSILELAESYQADPCISVDGEVCDLSLSLVDSGWQSPAVYAACQKIGVGIHPAKGHGRSHGCVSTNFYELVRRTNDRKPGDGWFLQRQRGGVWLVNADTDRWKAFEHARWQTSPGKPGAAYLYGEMSDAELARIETRMARAAKEHHSFARHITAEIETEDVVRGVYRRVWKTRPGRVANHYLDASYLASVAASMLGVSLLGSREPLSKTMHKGKKRPTLAELKQ